MHKKYEREIKKLDPNLSLTDTAAYAAAMLLFAMEHGANVNEAIKGTGVPVKEGREIGRRFRTNGIWRGDRTHHSGWDDPESGGIAFWMDASVGAGLLCRARSRPQSQKIGAAQRT
jgi:hypothetical protein